MRSAKNTEQISTWLVWLNAWKRQKAEQNWSSLTVLLCLCFAERRLMFGAQLEFMASAWRLCRVIVLLLLQERRKRLQTAELHRSSEVCFSCRQMAQTEDASALCRHTDARGLMSRLEFRCLQAETVVFTSKVRHEVWGHQMEKETPRSSKRMIC